MFQFIKSLIIWKVLKNNSILAKKCFLAITLFFVALYFFTDWESYFEKSNNLDMLLYTKISKYLVLICVFYLFFMNAKQLSILGAKEKKESLVDYKKTNSEEEYDPDLEIIRSKSQLRSHSDLIKEDIEKK
jgi:hypothetical protein